MFVPFGMYLGTLDPKMDFGKVSQFTACARICQPHQPCHLGLACRRHFGDFDKYIFEQPALATALNCMQRTIRYFYPHDEYYEGQVKRKYSSLSSTMLHVSHYRQHCCIWIFMGSGGILLGYYRVLWVQNTSSNTRQIQNQYYTIRNSIKVREGIRNFFSGWAK